MRAIRVGWLMVFWVAQLAVALPVAAQEYSSADTARAVHLLQRATYGVRVQDLDEVLRLGPEGWLERQLHPFQIADEGLQEVLGDYPGAIMPVADVYRFYGPPTREEINRFGNLTYEEVSRQRQRLQNQGRARLRSDLIGARLQRAIRSKRQLQEVMVGFWLDHFNIYVNKGQVRWLVADFEETALRQNVFSSFEEMLLAVASHPAMLYYLDNWRSSAEEPEVIAARGGGGPMAGDGQRRARRGINENYARELLELHTLGVDGGYTQRDVIEVARILTGWTVRVAREPDGGRSWEYVFRRVRHDRGEKEVLGERFASGGGEGEGERLLRLLARHPSTARHISRKLVERFVSDDPPQELVDTLTAVFLRTEGDLREVTRTLFTSPIFWDEANAGSKIKRPFELVVSAIRATDAELIGLQGVTRTLRTFGHLPYLELAPVGYPAQKSDWINSGAMLNRMNFGLTLGRGALNGVELPEGGWWRAAVRAGSREEMVSILADRILPGIDTTELESIILADLANAETRRPERLAQRALGLILGSPEFQRH